MTTQPKTPKSKSKLSKAQVAALEWLNNPTHWYASGWAASPGGALEGMFTRLSKHTPPLVEFTETKLFVRITEQGRAALAQNAAAKTNAGSF